MAIDEKRLAEVCPEAAELDDILSDPLTYDANDDVTIRRSWPEVKARLVELGAAEDERDAALVEIKELKTALAGAADIAVQHSDRAEKAEAEAERLLIEKGEEHADNC